MLRIIFIYTVEFTTERGFRVSSICQLDVYYYTPSHTGRRGVVFVFNLYPFVYAKGWKNLFLIDSVSHFQEISSFVDQKSLLILRFWLKLSKNISSFPIKFRTITPAINKVTKVLLEVYDYSTSEKVYRFKIQLVRILW